MKIQEKYDTSEKGISSNYMYLGGQYNQILFINYDDYFSYLERLANINDSSSSSNNKKKRNNLLNILSMLHIWNFSIDLDYELWSFFKLAQPLFEFNPVLIGLNSVYSVILSHEDTIDENISNDIFSEHVKYFVKNYILNPNPKVKKDMFTNRNILIESQRGYLVGLKNFTISDNLSHLIHLTLFGGLISLLGFKDNQNLSELIYKEKKVLKILSVKNYIKYTSFQMLQRFMFENNDNILLADKNYLLYDYIKSECSIMLKEKENQGKDNKIV